MANKTMTIQFGSVFGNYRWDAEAEIDLENETLVKALLSNGALQIDQRSPSTAAEKAIAGYDKRPKGFQRTSIPYSEKDAATLAKHLENLVVPIGEEDGETVSVPCVVNVREYEGAGGAQVKFAYERKLYGNKAGKLNALAQMVGYVGDVGSGKADEAPQEFLQAIKDWSNSSE